MMLNRLLLQPPRLPAAALALRFWLAVSGNRS
jgi:hypothetical protein